MGSIISKIAGIFVPKSVNEMFGKVQGFTRGKMTYLAAAVLFLQGAMSIIGDFNSLGSAVDMLTFLKGISASSGFENIIAALAVFGLRRAVNDNGESSKKS